MSDYTVSYHTRRRNTEERCGLCSGYINCGERYARHVTFDGGDVGVCLTHVDCHNLASDLMDTAAGKFYCYDRDTEGFGEWCLWENGADLLKDDISDELKARLRDILGKASK